MELIGYPETSGTNYQSTRVTSQKGDDLDEEVGDNNWQNRDNQYCRTVKQEE